jgi:hypothetical protein
MANILKPYTFSNGTVADGTQVNADFDPLYDLVNGNLDSGNIKDGAVTEAKLANNAVESAKVKDANITASKLATDVNTKVLLAGSVYSLTDGSTIAVDWSNGATQSVTLGATGRTVTFANPVAGQVYRLIIKQDSTGSRTITTWPTIKWAGGSAPTLTTAASKADIVTLLYDGASYYASATLNF